MKDWFVEWFNTPFYHLLYKNRNYEEAQKLITNLDNFFEFSASQSILDLACGKGRHSIFLNSKGYNVTGVDLSENNVNEANLSANSSLHFFAHDMREVFRSNGFDVVLNLFTSFGYFDDDNDNQRVIDAVAEDLKSGGLFVIDYMNGEKAIRELTDYQKTVDNITFHISKSVIDGFIIKNIDFEADGISYHFQEKVKVLKLEDFVRYFKKANLQIEQQWGNYDLLPFSEENSDRLIISARKP
jgi:SAM-dependent methyltransferase